MNERGSTMAQNPITEEIRAIRHRLAAEFDNDVYRIGAELRRRQAASGRRLIRLPKRTPEPNSSNPAPLPSDSATDSDSTRSTPVAG